MFLGWVDIMGKQVVGLFHDLEQVNFVLGQLKDEAYLPGDR